MLLLLAAKTKEEEDDVAAAQAGTVAAKLEGAKLEKYSRLIGVMQRQNEDFTPVGFDTLGAPGPGAEKMIKWLAGLFEDKYQFHKSQAVAYVRQRVSVVVHRCCLMMHKQVAERAAAKRQQKAKGRTSSFFNADDLDQLRGHNL